MVVATPMFGVIMVAVEEVVVVATEVVSVVLFCRPDPSVTRLYT